MTPSPDNAREDHLLIHKDDLGYDVADQRFLAGRLERANTRIAKLEAKHKISGGYIGQDALNDAAEFLDQWFGGRKEWPPVHRFTSILVAYSLSRLRGASDASDLERAKLVEIAYLLAPAQMTHAPVDYDKTIRNIAAALAEVRRATVEQCADIIWRNIKKPHDDLTKVDQLHIYDQIVNLGCALSPECDHHWIGGNDGLWCTKCKEEHPTAKEPV